jgi:neutral ceramidase
MKRLLATLIVAAIPVVGAFAAGATPASLRAGAARIDITPAPSNDNPPMNEYQHERLYLRAIVIDDGQNRAALIGADLGGINEDVWADASRQIAAKLKAPVENIIISSTHTHSDTAASETPAPGTRRYGSDFVAAVALKAVTEALAKLQPARVSFGAGEAHLNVNRDAINPETHRWTQASNPDAHSDKAVAVVSFVKSGGEPIAAYVNYAMHPVSGYLAGFVSGDFAAAASRHVEQAFGDTMVTVFTQGASGNQNPRWLRAGTNALASRGGVAISGYELVREDVEAPVRNKSVPVKAADIKVKRQLADYMQAQGIVLGEEVIRTMTLAEPAAHPASLWGAQTTLTCPGRKRIGTGREGMPGQYEDGPDVAIRLGVLGIGDIAIASANAEIYSEIGARVKQESPLAKTLFVTLANGRAESGYIPDDESFGHQTFQVLGSRLKPGCAEAGIAAGIAGLVSEHLAR